MIHPFIVGPMALSGIAFYQGEQNVDGASAAASYRCTFPRLVSSWQRAFRHGVQRSEQRAVLPADPADDSDLFFGFVQISGFCCAEYNTCDVNSGRHEDQSGGAWAALRDAQLSAVDLPMVGWSTNADRWESCRFFSKFHGYKTQ